MNLNKWRSYLYDLENKQAEYNPKLSLINESIFESLDLTHLTKEEISLLMEGRKDNVLKKYAKIIDDHALEMIINFDEQYKYKHLGWMAKVMAQYRDESEWVQEDKATELISAISDFVRYQRQMKRRDINQYSSTEDLLNAIDEDVIQPKIEKAREKRRSNPATAQALQSGEGTVIFEDDRYFVVRPDSTEASCHFGSKTRWCIAQRGNSYFSQYTEEDGKVYYFIKDDTKSNEDYNYKMAVEIYSGDGSNVIYEKIWDRFDSPTEINDASPSALLDTLVDSFEMEMEVAEQIVEAIVEHVEINPPKEGGLTALGQRIDEGEFDGGFVRFSAAVEYDEYSYLYLGVDITIDFPIENSTMIDMLNNDKIDIYDAEEAISEALKDEEYLTQKLVEDAGCSDSRWLWYEVEPEVDISENDGKWNMKIVLNPMQDPDNNNTFYQNQDDDVIRFIETMQEEWGERNEAEILEVLENHVYRLIPEIQKQSSDNFLQLKNAFTSGKHEISDNTWYTVDDEEDEMSDLNLMMQFNFSLADAFVNWMYGGKDFQNASGNTVKKATRNHSDALRLVKSMLGYGGVGEQGFLERAVYNVYQNAVAQSEKQLKLDFGPEFDFDDDLQTPVVPENIEISTKVIRRKGDEGLVPYEANLEIIYSIYIPFHKSEAELKALLYLFQFIRDNYDEITSYIYKYIGQYSAPMNGGYLANDPRPEQILKENLYYEILENKLFVEELSSELILFEKKRKKRKKRKKKKKKGKKDACYHKVRARYDVWPSAYASGALVKCRKVGAANWGNKSKKTNEEIEQELELDAEFLQEIDDLLNEKEGLHKWFSRKGAKGSKGGWVDCNAPDGKGGYKACGRSGDEKRKRYPACRPTAGQCKKKKGTKGKSWGKKDAKSRGKKK